MKNHKKLTTEIVDLYADFFNKEYYVNFFSRKNIYISKNFQDGDIRTSIRIGDLGGVPINSWEEGSEQADLFIISKTDYENIRKGIYSKEVLFISDLLIRKQTKVDEKEGILTSRLIIVKETDFLKYLKLRLTLIGKDLKMLDTEKLRKDLFKVIYPTMIKDSLKYDENKEEFYFKTDKGNIYISKENLKEISINTALFDNHQYGFEIELPGKEKMTVENENYSFPTKYIRIHIDDKEVAFTENVNELREFCENPTIELYNTLNF